jgi:hypothetical protein
MSEDFSIWAGGGMLQLVRKPDYEWQQIIDRLYRKYGIRSTKSKTRDKEILHALELKEAQKENSITTKFLTVSKNEQEKIQEKKKEKRVENNPKAYPNSVKGAEILGQQLYLAIKMKKEWEEKDKEKIKEKKRTKQI